MWWVSPFGNLRIKGLSHLPTAYRSVTRPSSPLNAKASIECPFALDCVNAQEYGYLFLSLRLCFFTRVQYHAFYPCGFLIPFKDLIGIHGYCTVLLLSL